MNSSAKLTKFGFIYTKVQSFNSNGMDVLKQKKVTVTKKLTK